MTAIPTIYDVLDGQYYQQPCPVCGKQVTSLAIQGNNIVATHEGAICVLSTVTEKKSNERDSRSPMR